MTSQHVHYKPPIPRWAYLSLGINGLLSAAIVLLVLSDRSLTPMTPANASDHTVLAVPPRSALGPRHQLNYNEWLELLHQEAQVVADTKPQRLTILAGDSLSLWFPADLLPIERVWLNQGISGETSSGLLRRLDLFDNTKPETIFVMIGINDLIRGISEDTVLANQGEIIRYLKKAHPKAQIVMQAILPHASDGAIWEGRDRLLTLSNDRIRTLNQRLADLASQERVYFLDLYPLMADSDGNLRSDLTTDGLHLSPQGYWVWRSAIQVYSQVALPQLPSPLVAKPR